VVLQLGLLGPFLDLLSLLYFFGTPVRDDEVLPALKPILVFRDVLFRLT
jgi:hypothetical protein